MRKTTTGKESSLLLLVFILVHSEVSGQQQQITIILKTVSDPADPAEPRTLICRAMNVDTTTTNVEDAVFYLNGTDIRHNLTDITTVSGRITFQLTQALEGRYTCGSGTTDTLSINFLDLVASPPQDRDIPRYYVQPVGGSVKMICGVKQGAFASLYESKWYYDVFRDVEQNYGDRAEVNRQELQDVSLTISPLRLTDTDDYYCTVMVGPRRQTVRTSEDISLLVYQEPEIHFLSSDQFHMVHPNSTQQPTIQFNCTATGSPELQILWFHNGNPIPSDSDDFKVTTTTMEEGRLSSAQSLLRLTDPRLANSGEITCTASIQYQLAENGQKGQSIKSSRSLSRNLVILDASLEPRPFATQDEDLLIRMDIPRGVTLPGVKQIRLKTTPPETSGKEPLEFPVDDVFFESSRIYTFVPASQLKFRQFYVQVALVVDGQVGPFNPSETTQLQFVDYDDDNIEDCDEGLYLHIIVPSACGTLIIVTIFIIAAAVWSVYDRRHACDSVFKYIKKQLEKESNKEEFNEKIYNDLRDMFQQVLDVKKKISGFEQQRKESARDVRNQTGSRPNAIEMRLQEVEGGGRGGGGGGGGGEGRGAEDEAEDLSPPEGGPTADGGIKSDGPLSVDGKELIKNLLAEVDKELKRGKRGKRR